jgi:ComF family protein
MEPGGLGQRAAGLLNLFLDLVFPPRCIGCGRVDHQICPQCRESIPWLEPPFCARCSRPVTIPEAASLDESEVLCEVCATEPLRLEGIRAVADHAGVMRKAVHALKYEGQTSLARPLAALMVSATSKHGLYPVDGIVPVPLHPRRLRERGYNQATLIARELARTLSLPILEDALVRSRATKTQTQLSAAERRVNVVDAFTAEAAGLAGRSLLLVDDVCTTGSTLQACADALRGAGASSVYALTLTRAHWDAATGVAQDGDAGRAKRFSS